MEINLKKITESEFYNMKRPILFDNGKFNRCFGIITNGKQDFGLAWNSNLIQPELKEIGVNIYSVGIDQNFGIIDFEQDSILIRLDLLYNFYTVHLYQENIFIITELKIIKLDKVTFEKVAEYDLPDFFEEIIFNNDKQMIIRCVDNTSLIII